MKNKLLKSLKQIQKKLNSEELDDAFSQIQVHIESLEDEEESSIKLGEFIIPESIKDKDDAYVVYSDGACRGNPGPGAYGIVCQNSKGDILFETSEVFDNTTNNRMELLGVIEGITGLGKLLNKEGKSMTEAQILVITDSKYVVDGISKWMDGWKARGWKKADKKPPENVEMWQRLDLIKEKVRDNLTLEWVKGHAGHPQNERCDQLANEALDSEGY